MNLARSFVAIMAVAALAACDDDDPQDEASIAGVYTVSQFRYTADSGSPQIDLAGLNVCNSGPCGILAMTVDADHSFNGTLALPGQPQPFPIGGDITLTGNDQIRIDFDAATQALGLLDAFEVGTYSMVSNTLTIELPNVTFDFSPFGGAANTESNLRIVGTRS